MIRGLYTAATGMNAQQHQIDVTSNNIANVNTYGYKRDRAEFADLLYESLAFTAGKTSESTRNPTGLNVGMGVRLTGIQKEFLQGNLKETGNPLDLAIEGKGFFKVTLPSGEEAFTRNGAFKLDEEGAMVNGAGFRLDPEIIIPTTVVDISIAEDGLVTALNPQTGATETFGTITITTFINPSGLLPTGSSLYTETEASGAGVEGTPGTDALGKLKQGSLESSNVKLVNEMVDLITAQRAYESNSKAISATDEMLDIVNRLKR
ncbi:MAG: flagellar basal-body rod protein FlgG [Campylobacteraceae bacterium]|nr:flagellar basal-body rod protein FlgG [Campylobacteraceae bacterium]